ncbi:SDR family NAD(P)-dependent oxidoreductase [Streptomyces morookaense]|uniref:SDR family NAD(P)-dependent oxidoreductase n=1 Tax=Streptomyces morookaense TaxID=1970 RepID=A0A7Y7B2P8_STRMO|nr:SDR family NAD(P)-dependent oxidoreductase [Streptomyces morookaense]NVK77531.1 SDR family NAD(P)-dependent oxidoreductase [Streptomyces morookaense]GHF22315.1 short-chain dehydrogenase [Streptomyces morookaense]
MTATGRTALVTGANRGLGLAVARELAARGHRVLLAARDGDAAAEAAAGLGGAVAPLALDVTDPDAVCAAARRAGEVDILVNNAGVLLDWDAAPSTVDLSLVRRALEVNLLGAWRTAQAVVPGMVARGWGRVVNVSSGAASFAYGPAARCPGYTASKVALNALTAMLAEENKGTGVLVNAINPGLVRTRMRPDAEQTPEEAARHIADAATLPDDGPTGVFLRRDTVIDW